MESQSPRKSAEEQRIAILRKAFEVYDVDGSGAIDYKEFKGLLQDLGWPSHEEFLSRAVRVLDQDMSGEIEFSEFLKWTKFAYASRVLYRHEMYGVGPRYTSSDDTSFLSLVGSEDDQSQNRKRSTMVRRASLTTVFEGKEDEEVLRSAVLNPCQADTSTEGDGSNGGPDLVLRNSESSQASDSDHAQTSKGESSGSRDREGSNNTGIKVIRFLSQNSCKDQKRNENANSSLPSCIGRKEEIVRADDGGANERKVNVPVREMAAMVLSSSQRGMRAHTSRTRSKSIGILSNRRKYRQERKFSGCKESWSTKLGPRTESKMTVRMRWVCGQFGNTDIQDDKQSLSASTGQDMEMFKKQAEENGGDEADTAQRYDSGHEEIEDEALSDTVSQEIGVDLRRVRSK